MSYASNLDRSMEAFVEKVLEAIVKESSRRDKQLREECDAVIKKIQENKLVKKGSEDTDADKYFRPFQLACEQKSSTVKAIALDAIEKMIARHYLRGQLRVKQGNVERFLIDIIVETVCLCRDDQNDNVQLQVIKALLTAVSSPTCAVREQSLLLAVRACYHIYLVAKNAVNKNTAKATLRQMLNIIFGKMENNQRMQNERNQLKAARVVAHTEAEAYSPFPPEVMYPEVARLLGYRPVSEDAEHPKPTPPPVAAVPGAFHPSSTSPDAVDLAGFPSDFHRDAFLLFRALCRLSMKGSSHLPGAGPAPQSERPLPLSAQAPTVVLISDEALQSDPVALHSKLLALDLVLSILEEPGSAFRTGSRFIGAIKQYLCVGLLKNILSSIPAIASTSLKVFVALMKHFKHHITAEIEVFISTLFLKILTSAHSSFEQKMAVLTCFRQMCNDPAAVLEMFLNYDCTPGRQDIFEESVKVLASISQGRASDEFNASQKTAAESTEMRRAAMDTLAVVMKAIVLSADASAKGEVSTSSDLPPSGAAAEASARTHRGQEADIDAHAPAVGMTSHAPSPSPSSPPAGPAPAGFASSTSSAALAKSYDDQKRKRAILEKAAVKFAVKQKNGIEFMVQNGICDGSPASVAAAFHELKDILDKTAMGDYMGEDKKFNLEVLHAYVDQMDFAGMTYDGAIRRFLSGFRIPGEAQKIDRIMEKFAERFCSCNVGVFPSADTAFILAYSMIMLQTDAHNPNIKPEKKMTKAAFLNNNRGIADGDDLPADFLGAIYDAIVSTPISLREDDEKKSRLQGATIQDERQRKVLQAQERAQLVQAGQSALNTVRRTAAAAAAAATEDDVTPGYYTIHDVSMSDHIRPMFGVAWGPLLAVFSVNLETSQEDDAWLINSCLIGFAQAIHVAGLMGMDMERDTLVQSLCKFTHLEPGAGVREMKQKNMACTRALLNIALNEGDRLGRSWGPVLHCVSQLSRLLMLAAGGKEDFAFFGPVDRGKQAAAHGHPATRKDWERVQKQLERDAGIEQRNAAFLASSVVEADITRLYTRSVALSSDAIVHFVTQLAAVSLMELQSVVASPPAFPAVGYDVPVPRRTESLAGLLFPQPRIFSLQKVVEVADFNMDTRPRMVWARVWDKLALYFTAVCCSHNASIAMYAIDSLKQLSNKFLEKPELRAFHFQTKFLQPFLTLMESTSAHQRNKDVLPGRKSNKAFSFVASQEIRELILHVCANLIQARHGNIRSGWRTFMGVYAAAASDTDELLVSLAFSTVHEVLTTHIEQVGEAGGFVDAVHCMVAFGSNRLDLFALRAIDHCATLGAQLARGKVPLTEDAVDEYQTHAHPSSVTAAPATSGVSRNRSASSMSTSSGPALATLAGEWYDLDGAENADVVDDQLDQLAASRMSDGSKSVDEHTKSVERSEAEASDYVESEASDAATQMANIFAYENQTDDAMLAADAQKGGLIRRFTDSRIHLRLWWPLLTGLAGLVSSDSRVAIRKRSLSALFALLRRYGPGFSADLWKLIYTGVLLPIFDDVRHVAEDTGDGGQGNGADGADAPEEQAPRYNMKDFTSRAVPPAAIEPLDNNKRGLWPQSKRMVGPGGKERSQVDGATTEEHEWLRTTCMPALSALIRLQTRFFTRLSFLLPQLFTLIESCIDQEIEGLARIGVACLRMLMAEAGPRFDTDTWNLVCASLGRLFHSCSPAHLLEARVYLLPDTAGSRRSSDFSDTASEEVQVNVDVGAGTADEAPAATSADAVEARFVVGSTVDTPYGRGDVAHIREEDGFVVVNFSWGTGYMHPSVPIQQPPAPTEAPATPPTADASTGAPAAASQLPVSEPPRRVADVELPFNAVRVVTQCVVQLELISSVGVLADAHLDSLELHHVQALLSFLQGSADFARRFNADRTLRKALFDAGFMRHVKHNRYPSLLRQEMSATQQLLILLLRLYNYDHRRRRHADGVDHANISWRDMALSHLSALSKSMVHRYTQLAVDVERVRMTVLPPFMQVSLQFDSTHSRGRAGSLGKHMRDDADEEVDLRDPDNPQITRDLFREASYYGPLVLQLLRGVLEWDRQQFMENLHWLYPLLTGLIVCGNIEIRAMLCGVFEERLLPLLPIHPDSTMMQANNLDHV